MPRGVLTARDWNQFGIMCLRPCTTPTSGWQRWTAHDSLPLRPNLKCLVFRQSCCKKNQRQNSEAENFHDYYHFSLKGDEVFTFRGDRTKQDIIDFALRVSGPAVQRITRTESILNLRKSISLFFVYVGPYEGILWVSL
jgi:hypothetical protein